MHLAILKSKSRKAQKSATSSSVVETRPASLSGAAEFLKEIYVSQGIMTRDQTLILSNPVTGEMDVSSGSVSKARPKQHASRSKLAEARNRNRRQKYGRLRDRRKSAKITIVSQQVTETKSGD